MLKGGSVEKRWQPMSAERWNLPVSRSMIFIAENTGRSGQPTQNPGGGCRRARHHCHRVRLFLLQVPDGTNRPITSEELRDAGEHALPGLLAGHRKHALAV